MLNIFLKHQWKNFWRSRNKAASIVARIIMGIFILYFLALALSAGFFMGRIIHKIFPGQDEITVFNGFILYYFLLDILARIQLQELPTLSVVPYLHLNIKKNKLVSFLNIKSFFSAFNIIPLILFLPFIFTTIASSYGGLVALLYCISIFSLIVFNNYLAVYLKRKSITNVWYVIVGLLIILSLAALEYFKIISIAKASDHFFRALANYGWISIFPVLAAIIIFRINSQYLRSNLYTEELSKRSEKKVSTDYPFLNRFGKVGELAALELKLILRHKRSRSSLIMGFIFLLYGFIIYKPELILHNKFSFMLFAACFITGIFLINYGQFMFAWQSAHFDGLLANKINFKNFIKAKFLLFTISSTITTILASFYGFISWKLVVMQFAVYFYIIGFGSVIVLFFATMNYKRLDITKSGRFNWQGTSAIQWIMSLPLIVTPFILYGPFAYYNKPFLGIMAIAVFGIANLFLRNVWVEVITKKFMRNRYKIANGFRES